MAARVRNNRKSQQSATQQVASLKRGRGRPKKDPGGEKCEKISVSLPPSIAGWIRDRADREERGNISEVVAQAVVEYRTACGE